MKLSMFQKYLFKFISYKDYEKYFLSFRIWAYSLQLALQY